MTPEIDRRTLIGGIAAATGAGLAPAAAQSPAKGAAMPLDIRPLPFDAKSISGLSEKIILSHQENNYSGAVRRYNAITDQLAASDFASAPNFALNG
ncbi:MAG: hypothetical protein SFV21_02335, partial [Rhodospirillaceae bacterium]|nr:hypothetical protein [Rhodospirillaceae bacterium]